MQKNVINLDSGQFSMSEAKVGVFEVQVEKLERYAVAILKIQIAEALMYRVATERCAMGLIDEFIREN